MFERALSAGLYVAAAEVATCLGEAGHETRAAALLERVLREATPSASCTPADLMAMRRAAIWYLGETVIGYGDPARAAVQARALVADAERTAGPADPLTLRAKILLARQVGGAGDPAEALSIAESAQDDAMARADTADDDIVHSARFEVAVWARGLHGAEAGVEHFGALLADSMDGSPDLRVDCAWNLGGSLIDAERAGEARSVLAAAVENAAEIYGFDHQHTLLVRSSYAAAVGDSGDPQEALVLYTELVAACERTIGRANLTTLQTRALMIGWLVRAGDADQADLLRTELVPELIETLGREHWLTRKVISADGSTPGSPGSTHC